jgi:hypothetical protein
MRKSLLAGACAVAISGAASAQFASDRNPPPVPFGGGTLPATPKAAPAGGVPKLPGGVTPVGGTTPAPTGPTLPSGFQLPDPVRKEPLKPVPTSYDPKAAPHEYTVTAEDGPWMILVKSYSGPDSKAKAIAFAEDIRKTHNTKSLLYERNAEERKAELARIEAVRKAEAEKVEPFKKALEQAKREAEATGSIYLESKATVKIPRPYHETPEQWAVLIGGFKTVDDARAALRTVRTLAPPKDTSLLDAVLIGGEEKTAKNERGEWKSAANFVNPYACAIVVPNPQTAALNMEEKAKLEPFVVKLNEGVENSLLGVKKPWTLLVKSYTVPTRRAGDDGDGKSVFDKVKKTFFNGGADLLQATAAEAEMLTKALRHEDMKPRSYEAFVLHHQVGSLVTVGQFDAPDDPELLKLQQELQGITFEMRDKDKKPVMGPDGKPLVQRLFDGVSLFPVPKH